MTKPELMKSYSSPLIIFILAFATVSLHAQSFTKSTTKELYNNSITEGAAFLNSYPQKQLYYALPLIDSITAIELALLSAAGKTDFVSADNYPDYVFAIGLQCGNDSLKNILLQEINKYDSKCAENMPRSKMKIDDYRATQMNFSYEYDITLRSALYRQVDKSDTAFLNKALAEYKYWGELNWGFNDTSAKPATQRLSMGKREFDPCLLASPVNGGFWRTCIYWLTGKKEYDFGNAKLNEVYKKTGRQPGNIKDPEDLKSFIRLGKANTVALDASYHDLESVDFDKEPALKEKLDECRKKDLWEIIIYTNGGKGLLYMNYIDKVNVQFSKQSVAVTSVYLLELSSPKTIRISNTGLRDRYF